MAPTGEAQLKMAMRRAICREDKNDESDSEGDLETQKEERENVPREDGTIRRGE